MRIFILILIMMHVIGCKREQVREINIGSIVMEIPSGMSLIERKGIDTYVAYLVDEKRDTFFIEYGDGKLINSLYQNSPPVFPYSQKESIVKAVGKEPSEDEVLFSETPDVDNDQRIFDKNFYLYDTINTIVVKVVQPKVIGRGVIGMYIPKLKDGKALSVYAEDVDSSTCDKALKMFRSTRYK